ncbi:MAG: UDP-N-acetylmuramate dehydrogenase [Gemmataceae bacterium]|nr:UDP-N-acetylmuramate dehydrogenase [Gemmataceae bacterium]
MVLSEFKEIIKTKEPLAGYTFTGLGGSCEMLATPRDVRELAALFQACLQKNISLRILGNGCNLLVCKAYLPGVVVRLVEKPFVACEQDGKITRMGAGASIFSAISFCAQNNLAGLETLVGIPGTIGGAVISNLGDRNGSVGRFVSRVEVLDSQGNRQFRDKEEISFREQGSDLNDPVLLSVEFQFDQDKPEAIMKRLKKSWVGRKINLPTGVPYAGKIFRNPRGLVATTLIEQAGLQREKIGGAEICDRDANYIILHPGVQTEDVLRLIEHIRQGVRERFNVELEPEISIW